MVEAPPPVVALIGFKRSKMALVGRMGVLVIRDGTVRVLGRKGSVPLDAAVGALTARLTKTGSVELAADGQSMVIYGVADLGNVHQELQQIIIDESHGAELIGPAPTGVLGVYSLKAVTGPAKISRALTEALHARGAGQG
ncbi:hypothetical protein DVA86_22270 [Streptomyces armeniacus]|uniref:Uncharacterized protein n=1 Tax=Streptomyces armeniacus TaxID=83291 RepID=A0A345XTJ7_9ACTN|nr:hypothetical protein [Streptomyces armeniacus]AXK34963.1 hypothetical protein DVA86_22270 [Streptomyces armeniacus]